MLKMFLELDKIDRSIKVDQGSVLVIFGLKQHFIIIDGGIVYVTDLHVIVHTLFVFGFLTTLVTQKHNTAPVPPVLGFTGNTGKHLIAGRLTGARDGEEVGVPVDTQS